VLRGASWNNNNPDNLLSSNRNNNDPTNRNNNIGFRVVVGVGERKGAYVIRYGVMRRGKDLRRLGRRSVPPNPVIAPLPWQGGEKTRRARMAGRIFGSGSHPGLFLS
jgi:hypothetical protein